MIHIYALICPQSGAVRYIGKTKNLQKRLAVHIIKAKRGETHHHCARWIRSLLAVGLRPQIQSLLDMPDGSDWQAAESTLIAKYLADGCDLTNSTLGGDGFGDMRPDIKAKRSETWRKTMADPERLRRFIEVTSRSRQTKAVKQKQSKARKLAWSDPEKKSRMLAGIRSEHSLKRKSDLMRQRMSDPQKKAEHTATLKARFQEPKHREQLRQASMKRWRDYRRKRKTI